MESVSAGGIIIPDAAKDKHPPRRGEVIYAGDKCVYCQVGDKVVFDKGDALYDGIPDESGTIIEYVFLKEEAILAITNR
jgi:co-chaperonin GroES (HSP10)